MVILEGPDGAGKTTLVRDIQQRFGLDVGERATSDRKLLYTVTRQDTYTALGLEVMGHEAPRVWDRLFYSELVYAPVVKRPVEFSRGEQDFIVDVIDLLEVPVVVCLPPFEVVVSNAHKDTQMDGVLDNLLQIYQDYASKDLGWPRRIMWYDYTRQYENEPPSRRRYSSLDQIYVNIDSFLTRRRMRQW